MPPRATEHQHNQQLTSAQSGAPAGTADALLPGIMLTHTEEFRPEEIFRAHLPACTREEAAELLDSLWCDYQSLSMRARSQVKILMSALTTTQSNSELR